MVSIALHASAAVLMRAGFSPGVASGRLIPIEFDAPEKVGEAPAAAPEPVKQTERVSLPPAQRPVSTPGSHFAAAIAVPVAIRAITAEADLPASSEPDPVHFVLTRAIATTGPARVTPSGVAAREGDGTGAVISEDRVSVPARLLTRAAVAYPPAARANEIEADIRVEIVVDTAGRVAVARCLRSAGYGLDEAAVSAVRAYRFSPALVDGRPVRVRMLWTVQFRLG